MKRQEVVETLAHRQYEDDDKSNLLEGLLHRQHESEIKAIVNDMHPADIDFILESLPVQERQAVWQLVSAEHDAEVLLEVDDWAREALIQSTNHHDLIAANSTMDVEHIPDQADVQTAHLLKGEPTERNTPDT